MTRTIIAAMLAVLVATTVTIQSAEAGPSTELSAKRHKHKRIDANGNQASSCQVVSRKTGAKATVGCAHVAKFQAYIDDLEAGGASVRFMGGVRRGRCSSSSMHPCGAALDVCQLSRGRVDGRCNLPGRSSIASIAARHGLFEGGLWCHSDYGHAQAGETAAACGSKLARRHGGRHRVAQADPPVVDRMTPQ